MARDEPALMTQATVVAPLMRAAVLGGAGQARIVRTARPDPGPGEIRIRLEGCGVCASNLGPWAGPEWMAFPTAPGDLGHEGWGTVDALGSEVTGLARGDRVAALSYHAYADYDVVDARAVVRLPEALADQPFPAEPLGCAVNIFRRSEIAAGQTVAIVGIGFLGAILTQLAARAGAHVIAISRRPFAREVAHDHGAAETIPLGNARAVIDRVAALTGGAMCKRVIEATGKQGPLDLAAELTQERGRLIVAGYHQDGPRQINMQLWNWRGIDVINAHERDPAIYIDGMRAAVQAAAAGNIDVAALCTHRYRLEDLGAALDATRDRPDGFLKAIVTF